MTIEIQGQEYCNKREVMDSIESAYGDLRGVIYADFTERFDESFPPLCVSNAKPKKKHTAGL